MSLLRLQNRLENIWKSVPLCYHSGFLNPVSYFYRLFLFLSLFGEGWVRMSTNNRIVISFIIFFSYFKYKLRWVQFG